MEIQLIYVSEATQPFPDETLDELLVTSAENNAAHNITGMLLYGNGKFMQVLEGEDSVVDRLLLTIRADDRHKNVNLLVRTPISQRSFSTWSMGFRRIDRDCIGNLEQFLAFFEEDFDRDAVCRQPNFALAVLKSFVFPRENFR